MKTIGVGLIGTGFMGRCHAMAFRNVGPVFGDSLIPKLEVLADVNETAAAAMAMKQQLLPWPGILILVAGLRIGAI